MKERIKNRVVKIKNHIGEHKLEYGLGVLTLTSWYALVVFAKQTEMAIERNGLDSEKFWSKTPELAEVS